MALPNLFGSKKGKKRWIKALFLRCYISNKFEMPIKLLEPLSNNEKTQDIASLS